MDIPFIKMHSCGNDYILLDCTKTLINQDGLFSDSFISPASARRFGVGSDGVIAVMTSNEADAEIRTFLSDGREELLNVNALICTSKFLYEEKEVNKDFVSILTGAGVKKVVPLGNDGYMNSCEVEVGSANFSFFEGAHIKKNGKIRLDNSAFDFCCLSLGDLYGVIFCDDVSCINADRLAIALSRKISAKVSVDTVLAQKTIAGSVKMRFVKSGCGEIFSCATGACCAIAAAVKRKICKKDVFIPVETIGGNFHIRCDEEYSLSVIGECEKIYDGIYDWNT